VDKDDLSGGCGRKTFYITFEGTETRWQQHCKVFGVVLKVVLKKADAKTNGKTEWKKE